MTIDYRLSTSLADRYRIEREVGQGGMATVYLATDLRHQRKVAVKVLRPELAALIGAERFLAEITTTAALQHPHILPLFDSGQAVVRQSEQGNGPHSFLYYVMPFIEGESLRDRLNREKQLPVADAIRIATEAASALDYAHRHHVIHRDIKPENILLHDGQALVADFGISLAVSSAGGSRMTETGMSLGTPQYMSPEQAMGEREIGPRSDVYALGTVTYEMLIGEPPFTGPSAQAIVAKVMTTIPAAMIPQRRTIPSHVEAAVLHAIEKLPADRFATGAEFAAALGNPNFTGPITAARPLGLGPPRTRFANNIAKGFPWVVALLAGLWAWSQHSPSASRPVRRYAVELRGLEAISPLEQVTMALSPDGQRLAYVGGAANGKSQIWLRDRDQLHARPISETGGATSLSWSPDGTQLAFETRDPGTLLAVPVGGGSSPVVVSDTLIATGGTAWSSDGFIYSTGGYNGTVGIVRVPATGGVPTIVTTIDTGSHAFAHLNPAVLPNNKGLVFSVWYGPTRTDTDIGVADIKTGKVKILQRGLRAVYAPTGHLLIVRADGSLIALPFDQTRMVTTGPAVPVLSGIATQGGTGADLAIGGDGTLAYYAGEPRDVRETVQPVWIARDGHTTPVDSGWTFNRPFNGGITLSPDGSRLALAVAGNETADIWIKQLEHGPFSRLTFEEFLKYRPSWSPDGRSLVYISDPGNNNASILQRRADGSGAAERLLGSDKAIAEAIWAPDGKTLVVRTTLPTRDILAFHPGVDSIATPLIASQKFDERAATMAPDGRYIAYQSDESGRDEIYIRPFPKTDDGRWQVSRDGGEEPLWGRTGREIFFRSTAGDMMAVPVTTGTSLEVGTPHPLFSAKGFVRTLSHRAYDVTPDDRRFVMLRALSDTTTTPSQLVLVDNWMDELRAKLKIR